MRNPGTIYKVKEGAYINKLVIAFDKKQLPQFLDEDKLVCNMYAGTGKTSSTQGLIIHKDKLEYKGKVD